MRNGSIRRQAAAFATLAALVLALPQDGLARGHGHRPHAADKPAAEAPPPAAPKQARQERTPFTAAETASAKPEGLPGALRIAGDDTTAFQRLLDGAGAASDPWLVLSGGGENGAYAAGILAGWTQKGDRPSFGVITGVSTGALIAPFAFVGPRADGALKHNYTEINAADVFEIGGTSAALTDNWPLKEQIDKSVTPDLMRAIAAEHAKGRRLLVVTTQVDTERPVVWDMGAIATLAVGAQAKPYGDKALKLFREVMLASSAVPGVFPPVMLDAVTEGGKTIQEMHDDGGAIAPYYLAPAAAIEGTVRLRLPTRTVYLVVNNRLNPEFGLVPRTVLGVLAGTVSAAIKAQTSAALALSRNFATRESLDLQVAEIDKRFTQVSPGPFDEAYMKALFEHGETLAKAGSAFTRAEATSPTGGRTERREGTAMPPKDESDPVRH